jgi:glycosyltransferase involved in cell wall biosynthesis
MTWRQRSLRNRADRAPLNVMFVITSMPVGGAETLLVQLVRGLDRERFNPSICCLKEPGPLGEMMAAEVPLTSHVIKGKYDLPVIHRLGKLMRNQQIDSVVTVGAGDKMFWGRLAARRAAVPVVMSAIHSTGWPDGIGRMNRMLTPITDAFVAVAGAHRQHLIQREGFPENKVVLIPNGIDVQRFQFDPQARQQLRSEWQIPQEAPAVGLVAALRPEKNHESFVRTAVNVLRRLPETRFVLVGEGPERPRIEQAIEQAGVSSSFALTGSRSDIVGCLSTLDLFLLTSKMEASPVSILEALSCERPVVSTNVGSIAEAVQPGITGYLASVDDDQALADHVCQLLKAGPERERMGRAGRELVIRQGSLRSMVEGYERLIEKIYDAKALPKTERHGGSDRVASPAVTVSQPVQMG